MDNFIEVSEQLKKGSLVILIDDVETHLSYLMGLAETVTGEQINLMTKIGKGLVYVCINNRKAKQLNLPLMTGKINGSKNFTVSIDHNTSTTGISAFERADTIKAITEKGSKPDDFKRPGHIFPLVYSDNRLLDHMGVVEASADLAKKLSNSSETTYLCEILNKDGGLPTNKEVLDLSHEYGIPSIKVTEIFKLLYNESICTFDGHVVHGQKLGRKLGFPTANLDLHTSNVHLKNGVYGVKVKCRGESYFGVMNTGVKPTLKNNMNKSYEIHILDFNHYIYGEVLNVEVKFFIREEKKFDSLNQLIQQIDKDIKKVQTKFELQKEVKIG
ncbi:3,4-dihydroxy-2-butanone-4-phosphate synthase [Alkalihalobacterium alkalinitrilicum]|uniref:3,4-dihydroxy-2-butanone-4-phosphate synthase n=1 Tax=Alkalihalobacterium alkalinitrilicum TaxID=427920 RepID=UPI000995224F|nr:3,4-dihydroxy-2-butanone-4-phosphate synthase [Alkalihalobacterium alkalinitrilicum]